MLTLPQNISCGYFDCSEFGSLSVSPKRTVTKFEMEFYLEDSKTTTTDNHTYEIKKDYIQIAKPGQIRHSELPFRTAYIKFNADGEIAEKLFMSVSAVKFHIQNMKNKTGFRNRTELAVKARESGLVINQ